MNTNVELERDDALMLVCLRNEFYRKKYRAMLGIYFLSLLCVLVLMGVIVYLIRNPTHPLYFATDKVARLIPEVPVQEPNMTTQDVSNWAVNAIESAYSYDFVNYRAQLQDSQKYFTTYGWDRYLKALKDSDNLLALTKYKYVVTAKVVGAPILLNEGTLGGTHAWKFQMPVLVTYAEPPYDGKTGFQNPLMVTVTIQRQDLLLSYDGLGISRMIAVLGVSPTQNMSITPTS